MNNSSGELQVLPTAALAVLIESAKKNSDAAALLKFDQLRGENHKCVRLLPKDQALFVVE